MARIWRLGTWLSGKGLDGGYRHFPISFEPLCNLQGWYTVYSSHTSHPPFSRPEQDQESLAWASTLSAEMPAQLAFALEPPKYSGPQGVAAFGRFARAAEAFKDLLLPDLTGPRVRVLSANATIVSGSNSGSEAPVLARAYVQQSTGSLPPINQSWCAVVIVINGAHAPARVQISLPAEQVPEYITTAWTMLPFNFYSVLLRNGSSASTVTSTSTATMRVLEDVLPANGVVHYRLSSADHGNELGCPGPR